MAEQYTSIGAVLDAVMMHPMLRGVGVDATVRYTVEFMKVVGCPLLFDEKVEKVKIDNYRGVLPCDYYAVIQVRDDKTGECYRETTDSFHMAHGNGSGGELTYKIQGGIIFTSEKDRDIEIAYEAMLEDENGFPLIPDNAIFIRALESYIKLKYFTILFDMGKLNVNVINNVQQEYAWNVGQCQTEFVKLSLDKAEALSHILNAAIERHYTHREGRLRSGNREELKKK